MKLIEKEYLGIILPDKDPKHQGRYKVYIPNLMPHLAEDKGIWVKNHIHKNRVTPSEKGIYGSYQPLQEKTQVIIKFFENDYNTGYVDRIISDFEIESLPLKIKDRDDLHQIFRTPKNDNLFVLNEETTDQPANSIHLYFNKYRTTIVIDEEGIHVHSDDNRDELIEKDVDEETKQNQKLLIHGNYDIYTMGETKIYGEGTIDVRSGTSINCDAPVINLNCGSAGTAEQADVPERKYDEKTKSDPDNTRMIIKEDTFDDYDYFKK